MKRISQGVMLFLCTVLSVYGQDKDETVFGRVTQQEMDMTVYPDDPDAEAVVLGEWGETYFRILDSGVDLYMTKKSKIKILNQAGLKYGNIEIPYYIRDAHEQVYKINAITYNYENGQLIKTPLDSKNIFDEKTNEYWRVKKFAMPNLKPGSIIEVEYTIISPYVFNLREWRFQYSIPVVQSRYEIKMVPFYEYAYILKGMKKFDVFKNEMESTELYWANRPYKEMKYTMGMNNIPAFRDEEFITSVNDYRTCVNFQLSRYYTPSGSSHNIMSTWPELCNDFLKMEDFGKYLDAATKYAKKILPELQINTLSPEEKIRFLSEYIKSNYNFDGIISKFARKKLAGVLKEKTGNSAELNLLLLGFLRQAGISAKPIMLSTREHGAVSSSHPFQQFLNYVIVQVQAGEKQYFLDATEPLLAYNELPTRCMNVKGLVVEKNSEQWIDISQDDLALTEKKFEIVYRPETQEFEAKTTYSASGYDAYLYRSAYAGNAENLKKWLFEKSIPLIDTPLIEPDEDTSLPFVFSFHIKSKVENSPDKLFIPPFLHQVPRNNIFKQKNRVFPVDIIWRDAGKYSSEITIPEGYQVEFLPKEANYNGKTMTIKYAAEQRENKIIVSGEYAFKNNIYEAKEYQVLKLVYDELIKKMNESIVLSKIIE